MSSSIDFNNLTEEQKRRYAEIALALSKSTFHGKFPDGIGQAYEEQNRRMNEIGIAEDRANGIYTWHIFRYMILDLTDRHEFLKQDFGDSPDYQNYLMIRVPELLISTVYGSQTQKDAVDEITEMIKIKVDYWPDHEAWTKHRESEKSIAELDAPSSMYPSNNGFVADEAKNYGGYRIIKMGMISVKCDKCESDYVKFMTKAADRNGGADTKVISQKNAS